MISQKTIDEINAVAKIDEVVSDFIPLKKRGSDYLCVCPFHNDTNPSMHVNTRLGLYHCFVCDAKGGPVKFLMEYEKLTYPEALRRIARKYNIEVEEDRPLTDTEVAQRTERESLFAVNHFAEEFFINQLWENELGKAIGLSYFQERGFTEATIKRFRLGFDTEEDGHWDTLTQEAIKQGYKVERLKTLGLTKETEKGKLYDFYHGRVIFPIHDATGKVVGFGGRLLEKKPNVGKYFNSPESEIYHKSDVLYGFYFAKKTIRAKENVYLVEGYTDVISMSQAGIENVVASSGTALTTGQVKLISQQTKNITILYDGDEAGIKAALRGVDLLLAAEMNIKVVVLPPEHDPDTFARSLRISELEEYLETHAENFILFKAKTLMKKSGDDPMARSEIVQEILNNIAQISNMLTRAFYIKELAAIFEVSEEVLTAQLQKILFKQFKQKNREGVNPAADSQQPMPQTGTSTPDIVLPPSVATPAPKQTITRKQDFLMMMEKNILELILRYGMYMVQIHDTDGRIVQKRIDQFVFDEFYSEAITFSNSLYQRIYDEYAEIAMRCGTQEEIQFAFTRHQDEDIRNFAQNAVLMEMPNCSEGWKDRFEINIYNVQNHVRLLNDEVMNDINMFKMRTLEHFSDILQDELKETNDAEAIASILKKQKQVLDYRRRLADMMNIVITK